MASADEVYEVIGKRIAFARLQRGITQVELAGAVGLTRSSVTNAEAGRQHLPLHTLVAIAQALDIDVVHLLDGDLPQLAQILPVDYAQLQAALRSAREALHEAIVLLESTNEPPRV